MCRKLRLFVALLPCLCLLLLPQLSSAEPRCHVEDFDETCSYADTLLGWFCFAVDTVSSIEVGDTLLCELMSCWDGVYHAPADTSAYIAKRYMASTAGTYVSKTWHYTGPPDKDKREISYEFTVKKDDTKCKIYLQKNVGKKDGKLKLEVISVLAQKTLKKNEVWKGKIKVEIQKCQYISLVIDPGELEFTEGTTEDFCISEVPAQVPSTSTRGLALFIIALVGSALWILLGRRRLNQPHI